MLMHKRGSLSTYVIGGCKAENEPLSTAEQFDGDAQNWKTVADMMAIGGKLAAASLNGALYVVGGGTEMAPSDSMQKFDTVKQKWKTLNSMSTKRVGHAVVALGSALYVFGGTTIKEAGGAAESLDTAEKYDSKKDQWSQIEKLTLKRGLVAGCAFKDKVLAIGGYSDGPNNALDSCEMLEFGTSKWSPVANMNEKRYGAAAISDSDNVYVFGGMTDTIEQLDTSMSKWTLLSVKLSGNFELRGAIMNGHVYLIGGEQDSKKVIQVFDIAKCAFDEPIIPLTERSHAAIAFAK